MSRTINRPLAILACCVAAAPIADNYLKAQAVSATGQAAPNPPRFEVVSVHPCADKHWTGDGRIGGSPGRLSVTCETLEGLIRNAYLLYPSGKPWSLPARPHQTFQSIKGSSGWVQAERFTINARSADPASLEMMRGPMMQTVLTDRFKLKIHREARDYPGYELTVATGGPKLQPAKPGGCVSLDATKGPPVRSPGQPPPVICGGFHPPLSGRTSGLDADGLTMSLFCLNLSQWLDRDVIDKTGVTGSFDIHLELSQVDILPRPGRAESSIGQGDSSLPVASEPGGSVASAIRRLGLALRPVRIPGEFLVIDHAERPSEN
jgi:uncharacterized protein (TIGR03435 family)